jgi:preprotein translocase SecE subunit
MTSYKPDQGRMARMAVFWALAALGLFGCTSLHTLLSSSFDSLATPLGGIRIPIVGIDLSGSFLITAGLLGAIVYALHRWLQRPKSADLLIDTEAELKKVTWPSLEEVINSSVVVIVFVLVLMGYLAGTDYLLGNIFTRILLG